MESRCHSVSVKASKMKPARLLAVRGGHERDVMAIGSLSPRSSRQSPNCIGFGTIFLSVRRRLGGRARPLETLVIERPRLHSRTELKYLCCGDIAALIQQSAQRSK